MKKEPMRLDKNITKKESKSIIKPTKVDAKTAIIDDVVDLENRSITSIKAIGSFAKKSILLFFLFASIMVVGVLYDAFITASSMLNNAPFLGVLYSLMVVLFIAILAYYMVGEYLGYKKIKRVDELQYRAKKLQKKLDDGVYEYADEIIKKYIEHDDKEISKNAKELSKELKNLMRGEVLERIEEKLLIPLDKLAQKKITKYASQTALSTAISPVALIDAALIISRSHVMVHDIAKIYGYRPNFLGEVVLFKKVFAALAFASVTDILANHSGDLFGTSFLSKLSLHSAQGMANGILVARVGVGVIKATRPIPLGKNSGGFLRSITSTIAQTIFSRDK